MGFCRSDTGILSLSPGWDVHVCGHLGVGGAEAVQLSNPLPSEVYQISKDEMLSPENVRSWAAVVYCAT